MVTGSYAETAPVLVESGMWDRVPLNPGVNHCFTPVGTFWHRSKNSTNSRGSSKYSPRQSVGALRRAARSVVMQGAGPHASGFLSPCFLYPAPGILPCSPVGSFTAFSL